MPQSFFSLIKEKENQRKRTPLPQENLIKQTWYCEPPCLDFISRVSTNLLLGLKLIALLVLMVRGVSWQYLVATILCLALSLTGENLISFFVEKNWQKMLNPLYTGLIFLDALVFDFVLVSLNLVSSDFYLLGALTLLLSSFRGGIWIGVWGSLIFSFFYFFSGFSVLPWVSLIIRLLVFFVLGVFAGAWGEVFREEISQKVALKKDKFNLSKVVEMKDSFISVAVHNLRSPLTSLKGVAEILQEEGLSEEEKSHFWKEMEEVHFSVEKLIEDLLEISRIRSPKAVQGQEQIDPLPIIQSVFEEMKPAAEAKELELEMQNQVSEAVSIQVNRKMFENSLNNLLENAIKYTKEGKVTVRTWMETPQFLVAVTDTGRGIPKEDQSIIFEPFERGKSKDVRDYPGTGLGLYIVKNFVESVGGKINLKSVFGKGSTFTLSFDSSSRERLLSQF